MPPAPAQEDQHYQVLELVLTTLADKRTLFHLSHLSYDTQRLVHDAVRQRLPALLPVFLAPCYYDGNGPCAADPAIRWLCHAAGHAAVSSVSAARAVLNSKGPIHWLALEALIDAGLTVTDSLVIEAAKQRAPNVQVVVDTFRAIARSDPAVQSQLQIGDALRCVFECCTYNTYGHQGLQNIETFRDRLNSMSPAQLPGLLHVVANMERINSDMFKFLLSCLDDDKDNNDDGDDWWQSLQHYHDSRTVVIKDGEHAQQVTQLLLEVLKTCLLRRHAGYVRYLVKLLRTATWVVEPGARACAELLHAAVSNGACSSPYKRHTGYGYDYEEGSAPACVHALQRLAGVTALPQAAYVSLLHCSLTDPATGIKMLQMPQAQHVNAGELCVFLATAISSSSPQYAHARDEGPDLMHALLQLPAAAQLTQGQILQLTKLAVHKSRSRGFHGCGYGPICTYHGGSSLIQPRSLYGDDRCSVYVLNSLAGLTGQLTADSVLHLLSWATERKFDRTLSILLGEPFVMSKLEAPETFLGFTRVAEGLGMLGSLVEVLRGMPALATLQPKAAFNLLHTLSSTRVSHPSCRHAIGDYMHTRLLLEDMQLEGLAGEQCGVLLDLAVSSMQYKHACMLCMLPAAQLVDVTILEQLIRRLLLLGETSTCDGYCWDLCVRTSLLQGLLSLPAASSFSATTVQGLMEAAVQAVHLPFVVLLAERLHVSGYEIHLSQGQLLAMLQDGATDGDVTGISLLISTATARGLTTQDLQDVLVAATAPRRSAWPGAWYYDARGSLGSRTQVSPNRAAAIGLLMRLPAAAALPTSAVAALLKQSIAQGHADTARELLALPAAQLDTQVLEQQCLHCADDDAVQYKNSWMGQKTLLEALLQHPVAKQFGPDTLQRLVSAFAHPAPHRYGTEFHPLALVLELPVVQVLDSVALLGLVTTCIEALVPAHSITAAMAAPAAAEWSAAQVNGLLLAAACARHPKALDQVLQHPSAPAATDPDVQLCRALFSAEDYTFWLPVPEQPAYPSYYQSYNASPVDRYCCYCS